MPLCNATTKAGKPCKKLALTKCATCAVHRDPCSCCFKAINNANEWIGGCSHRFHFDCIKQWSIAQTTTEKTCPLCRVALPTALQYPKTIISKYVKWVILTEDDAIEYIEFVQKRGRSVANEFCDIKQKSMVDNPNDPLAFTFSLNKHSPMKLTIDPDLLPVLDLWEEFESLHNQLTDIVIATMK